MRAKDKRKTKRQQRLATQKERSGIVFGVRRDETGVTIVYTSCLRYREDSCGTGKQVLHLEGITLLRIIIYQLIMEYRQVEEKGSIPE